MRILKVVFLFASLLLFSCNNVQDTNDNKVEEPLTASEIIDKSYKLYGIKKLQQKNVSFKFRQHQYSFIRNENGIVRIRKTVDTNNREIKDVWKDDNVQRFIDDSLVNIDNKKENAYRNSINSVFYFAFLPEGLTDLAVNTELLEEVRIKGKDYYKLRVTFDKEGGGEDYNDIFIYWFDKKDFSMDYLAYEYFTEGGGIRFREAINAREIDGIIFQDYINYKPASKEIQLEDTDQASENGNLKEVSRIELENVKVE